ncbi:prohibitin family protein [Endothiovibrio diazotrophicus]
MPVNRFKTAITDWVDRHWVEFFAFGALLLLLLVVLWPLIVYNVPPGHVGVMWHRFFGGTVTLPKSQLREGLHVIWPWDKIYIYDARLQKLQEEVKGLSVDGLEISVNLSSRFVIVSDYAGYLHKAIGPNYVETLLRPQLRTLILTYLSEHEAADLYSTRREQVQTVVQTRFQAALAHISSNVPFDESYVNLEDVLIEEIHLPDFVSAAIEQKERVRHMSEAYVFRLQLEEKERQRKRIEAEGIRSFQEIVAPGITDSYLRWRGIEATLQLAQSNNAKVIMVGGADGLPVILNTEGGNAPVPPPYAPYAAAPPYAGAALPYASPAPATAQPPADANAPQQTSDATAAPPQPSGSPAPSPANGNQGRSLLDPFTDLLRGGAMAGPNPLTASGFALQRDMMNPPGSAPDTAR